MRYCRVVVDSNARELSRTFTYSIPEGLEVGPGTAVEVPFGPRSLTGYVLELTDEVEFDAARIRPITQVLDARTLWGEELLRLAEWLRIFYSSTYQESLQTVIPGPVLARVKKPAKRKLKAAKAIKGLGEAKALPTLRPAQAAALEALDASLQDGKPLLLFGVTGSGKTEVYLHAVSRTLEAGRQAIVLVPEVSLTPQAVDRYRGRLGDTVGVLHSGLSGPQRREQWWQLREGQLRVALGTRSAVFAPLADPGLIVVDEEHDGSYKQDQTPRYHARQVAAWRAARQSGPCALVLGSATPSLETFHLAGQGRYRMAQMQERASGAAMPSVSFVDMKRHRRGSLSPPLLDRLRHVVAAGQQAVLLLNRRGFSQYLQCQDCGHVVGCDQCSIALTYHRRPPRLACHYCFEHRVVPDTCSECGGMQLEFKGTGTERLEEELEAALPGVTLARMDRDTTGKVGAHAEILQRFGSGEAQILLGTQMVSKGLDFPRVTLVGVLNADQGLNMPDFRAGERTFQLITQVAGRAGRADLPGEVLIQAMDPEHPVLLAAAANDYLGFAGEELAMRRSALYPPYCRLLRVLLASEQEEPLIRTAQALAIRLRGALLHDEQVVGPAPCPLPKLRGLYRWHMLLKGPKVQDLTGIAQKEIATVRAAGVVRIGLDPDPQSLL